MRVIFDEELKAVADDLDRMVQDVRKAINGAGNALLNSDLEAAQAVIDGDIEIDALESSVIDQCTYPQSPLTDDAKALFTEMQEFLTMTADRMVAMLQDRNTAIAEQVIMDDDKLDALHQKTFDLMLSDEWQGTKQQLIDLVLLGRYMERLGDHAVSAARRVVFIVSGFDPSKEPSRDEDGSVY